MADDGRRRCPLGRSHARLPRYHDEEWGRPVTDDRGIYERLVLEGFQSGLSWLTILRKRESFRAAFAGLRHRGGRALRRARRRAPAGRRRRSSATAARSRRRSRTPRRRPRSTWPLAELVWSHAPERAPPGAARARRPAGVTPESTALVQGAQAARLSLRRPHHRLRGDAGVRHRQRPPGRAAGCAPRSSASGAPREGVNRLVKACEALESRSKRARARAATCSPTPGCTWPCSGRSRSPSRCSTSLADSPEFFVARGNTSGDIVLFAFGARPDPADAARAGRARAVRAARRYAGSCTSSSSAR